MKRLGDILTVSGLLVVAGGVAWVWLPAGVIVLGLAVAAVGVLLDVAGHRQRGKDNDR